MRTVCPVLLGWLYSLRYLRTSNPSLLRHNARVNLVVDDELGIVVTGSVVPCVVYPYGDVPAFIPDRMTEQAEQETWFENNTAAGAGLLLNSTAATAATGETLQVFQFYNSKLQAAGYALS